MQIFLGFVWAGLERPYVSLPEFSAPFSVNWIHCDYQNKNKLNLPKITRVFDAFGRTCKYVNALRLTFHPSWVTFTPWCVNYLPSDSFLIAQRIVFSFSSPFSPVLLQSESNLFEFVRDFGWITIPFIAGLLNQFTFIRFTVHWIKLNCFSNNSVAIFIRTKLLNCSVSLHLCSKYYSPCVALPVNTNTAHEYLHVVQFEVWLKKQKKKKKKEAKEKKN